MRQAFHVATIAMIFTLTGCKSDLNSPMSTTSLRNVASQRQIMTLSQSEQEMINDYLKDIPPEKAARLRALFSRDDVAVASNDPEQQEKINAIYKAISTRRASESRRAGFRPSPKTAENSWTPNAEEESLLQNLLNRIPARERVKARERLLRTDVMAVATNSDPQIQDLLDRFYKLRHKRMADEADANWKK